MSNAAEKKHLWQSPVAIMFVALALRLVAVRLYYTSTWNYYEDHLWFGFETGRISRSIAEGQGFGNPLLAHTGPTAWLTPVYPYLLAGVFKLFGVYSKTSAFVILSLNVLFSALICLPLYRIAQRSFGRGVAVTACWIWTLYPYFIYIPSGFVWDTCLGALLASILFLFALKLKEQSGTRWSWLGFGVLGGLCALTNASTLTLCPILAAWAIYPLWKKPLSTQNTQTQNISGLSQTAPTSQISQTRSLWLSPALLVVTGLVVTLLPWQVRNYRAFHTLIPLRDTFWLEFWVGNDGNTSSWLDTDVHPSINPDQKAAFVRLGEIPYFREKRREALALLAQHPGLYVVQCLRRFLYLWTGFWNLDPSNLQDEFHGFANVYLTVSLTLAMLVGLWRAWRNSFALGDGAIDTNGLMKNSVGLQAAPSRQLHNGHSEQSEESAFSFRSSREAVLPFLLVLALYPVVFYLTHPTIRYRHIIDPEIVVLAALGLRSLISRPALRALPSSKENS
ncbi:MAG TPA: glycosyltransferase family 39 protein [Candidatus Acidoferrum sp.]|nr:glycosyltransferase family 39 protein [Candidatus Acidoferrum sp.]